MGRRANGKRRSLRPLKQGNRATIGTGVGVPTFDEMLQVPPSQFSRLDLALCNLLCATGLPGAEDMDIREYMRRLQALTEYVRKKTERQLPIFRLDPSQFGFPRPVTGNFFRIIVLVHALKTDGRLRYNPRRTDASSADMPFSSKDMLINGLLSDERIGTCNTMPVLISAVGRRLGYPLHLVCTHNHVWTRWEGDGERFNIEASGPGDFSDYGDDHFRHKLEPLLEDGFDTSYYLRNLTPADELALFLFSRAWVLEDHGRWQESLTPWAKACYLAPAERMYAIRAYYAAYEVLHIRKFGKPSVRGPDRMPTTTVPVGEDLRKLLPPKELGMFQSINGHFHEARGEVELALDAYKKALMVQPDNPDYRADLERYVRRLAHGGPPSFAAHAVARGLGLAKEVVAAYEQRGLRFEQAEDWAEAQCSFVQGGAFRDGASCREHLKRAIRKEIDSRKEPCPGPQPPDRLDPRFDLPHELQGTIWMFRDLALRSLGRLDEALTACKECCRLWPKQKLWAQELRRFSQEQAKRKLQAKPRLTPALGQFVSDVSHNVVLTGLTAPVHMGVTLSGSLFPPLFSTKPPGKG